MNDSTDAIAYFGIPGSFTHGAACKYFGDTHNLMGGPTFRDVFVMVKQGEASYGIVPIENTLAGSVYENYDLLSEYGLSVVGEVSRKVEQSLLVVPLASGEKPKLTGITSVYSHPKALEQCSVFLDKHPQMHKYAHADTATAAKYVGQQMSPQLAAIANVEAGEKYGLVPLKTNIQNNSYNYTRFLVLAKQPAQQKTDNKCSLMVLMPHTSGSLSKALTFLTDNGFNLTKIESRPIIDKPFEYIFYLDFVFDPQEHDVIQVLKEFEPYVSDVRCLGIYQAERKEPDSL